jgi:cell division protein FtsB
MNQECYRIVFFDQGVLRTRHLKIYKRTFYLIAFLLFFLTIFFCDYIQLKKHALDLNRVRQTVQFQTSQIQFFTMRIEELEGQLSKLMDFDKRIRVIANLERNQEMVSFIGTGGTPPTNRRAKLKTE